MSLQATLVTARRLLGTLCPQPFHCNWAHFTVDAHSIYLSSKHLHFKRCGTVIADSVDSPSLAGSGPENTSTILLGGAGLSIYAQQFMVIDGLISARGQTGDGVLGGASGGAFTDNGSVLRP